MPEDADLAALSEAQWQRVEHLILRSNTRGRPSRDPRVGLNGILWILRRGAPWRALPPRFGPWQTVYARFRSLQREGRLREILTLLDLDLPELHDRARRARSSSTSDRAGHARSRPAKTSVIYRSSPTPEVD
ncbi:MAG: transposase [Longimicrobiales bacterium]